LQLNEQENDDRRRNLIHIQLGFTYFRMNDWQSAKEKFENGLQDIDKLQPFEKSMILYGLGNINFEKAEYKEAQQNYNQALDFANQAQDKSLIALLLNNLGIVANVTGNLMKAISLYSKAIPLYKENEDSTGLARIYNNIGMTYADEHNWEQANQFYGKSLGVTGALGLAPLKSITFLNRALALAHLNETDDAREYSYKAIRLLEDLNDELGIAEYHKIQGILEAKAQNWSESEKHFIEAIETFSKYDNKLGQAESLLERAVSNGTQNHVNDVQNWLLKAYELFRQMHLSKKAKLAMDYIETLKRTGFVQAS
jgi:tetratricopeptide (TPR) repeat protein